MGGATFPDTISPWQAYKLRLQRKQLIWRAFRARHALRRMGHPPMIAAKAILGFACVRDEALRLPYWLDHHRALGVDHFLIVDNGSEDGSLALLADQADVTVWQTDASYRDARFGMDWVTWLHYRFAHGHWALTLDADELLMLPHHGTRGLRDLTRHLDQIGAESFGALMVEPYPEGPLGAQTYAPGQDPTEVLTHFDGSGYWCRANKRFGYIDYRGGVRERMFFADRPLQGPHLHKVPLIRWQRGHVYASSMHFALPRGLNRVFDARDGRPYGALLHTKFLPDSPTRATQEQARGQHFTHPDRYGPYYAGLAEAPRLMGPCSQPLTGWESLETAGLMSRGDWT